MEGFNWDHFVNNRFESLVVWLIKVPWVHWLNRNWKKPIVCQSRSKCSTQACMDNGCLMIIMMMCTRVCLCMSKKALDSNLCWCVYVHVTKAVWLQETNRLCTRLTKNKSWGWFAWLEAVHLDCYSQITENRFLKKKERNEWNVTKPYPTRVLKTLPAYHL